MNMNDDEIKEQFRQRIEKLKSPTKVPLPNQKLRELQPIQKAIDLPVQSNKPNVFMQFINTKGGSLTCLMIFGVLLAFGQTNSATPFKFILCRNLLIAYIVNWWRFRKSVDNDE